MAAWRPSRRRRASQSRPCLNYYGGNAGRDRPLNRGGGRSFGVDTDYFASSSFRLTPSKLRFSALVLAFRSPSRHHGTGHPRRWGWARLANLGIGHAAVDVGGSYTYLDTTTGWEFSATAGLTYNFENPDTDYQNGIDSHLDVGISRFLDEQLSVGLVGFAYVQLTPDD
ncbi:transporter [Rhizobium leguminosarum]